MQPKNGMCPEAAPATRNLCQYAAVRSTNLGNFRNMVGVFPAEKRPLSKIQKTRNRKNGSGNLQPSCSSFLRRRFAALLPCSDAACIVHYRRATAYAVFTDERCFVQKMKRYRLDNFSISRLET